MWNMSEIPRKNFAHVRLLFSGVGNVLSVNHDENIIYISVDYS